MSKQCDFIIRGPPMLDIPSVGLGQYFLQICQDHNDKVALIDAVTKVQITYKQLSDEAVKLAIALQKRGITQNDVISICGKNSIYYPIVVLATFYLGNVLAPYNNAYGVGELEHVISLSKPRVIFCSPSTVDSVRAAANKFNYVKDIIFIEPDERVGFVSIKKLTETISAGEVADFKCREIENTKERDALIMCSSGTTGLPKGVIITHHNLLAAMAIYTDKAYDTSTGVTHTIGFLPPFHVFGLFSVMLSIHRGAATVVLEQFHPELFLQAIQDYKISLLAVVPPMLSFLAKHPLPLKYDLSSLEELACGAAPLGPQLEDAVLDRFKHVKAIRQGYGMTECTLGVLKVPADEVRKGSVGLVVPGCEVKVVDIDTKKPLGPNKSGEICFRGPIIMKGYIDNPKATAETIDSEGWLHSGDIGYYDGDEWFYIVDRLKELIKYKGYQVPPAELEALLITHPAVLDAAVIGIPDDDAGELPKAFIVKKSPVTENEIRDFVASRVSNQKRLRGGVQFIDAIPKNPSGKIMRRFLRNNPNISSKL